MCMETQTPATQEEGNGQFQCITEQECVSLMTTLLLHLHVVHWLPLCWRLQRHHHGNHNHTSHTHSQKSGGIVHSHAGTRRSVWRWFCNKTSPLTHTEVGKVQSSGWNQSSDHITVKRHWQRLTQYTAWETVGSLKMKQYWLLLLTLLV